MLNRRIVGCIPQIEWDSPRVVTLCGNSDTQRVLRRHRLVALCLVAGLAASVSACAADDVAQGTATSEPAQLVRHSLDVAPIANAAPPPTAASDGTVSTAAINLDTAVMVLEPETPPPPPPPPIPDPVPTVAPPVPYSPGDRPALGYGATGPAVAALQARLTQLGYRTDGDSYFGDSTADAVLALRKAESLPRSYDVDGDVWARLEQPLGFRPAATGPNRVEVDLARQVLFVVHNGQVITLNTSTGNGETYIDPENGSEQVAETPTGRFSIYEAFDGDVKAPLGTLYRPMYFLAGWAVHGSGFVPSWPDSHGCARVSYPDIDFMWSLGSISTGTPVLVHPSMGPPPPPPAPVAATPEPAPASAPATTPETAPTATAAAG